MSAWCPNRTAVNEWGWLYQSCKVVNVYEWIYYEGLLWIIHFKYMIGSLADET